MLTNDVDLEYDSPTCHPTSPLAASSPPTILGAYLFMLNLLRPQKHLQKILIFTWTSCFILKITHPLAFLPPPGEAVGLIVVVASGTKRQEINELMFNPQLLLME